MVPYHLYEVFNSFSVDTKVTPLWNTMASIPGHIRDEVVLIGCHRDGTHVLLQNQEQILTVQS